MSIEWELLGVDGYRVTCSRGRWVLYETLDEVTGYCMKCKKSQCEFHGMLEAPMGVV